MVVTVGTVFIALFKCCYVFSERLSTLLAQEYHFRRSAQRVVCCFCVAICTVEPLPAARSSDGDLGIQNMLAAMV